MELAPNPRYTYSGGTVAKALGGSFKLVKLTARTVREMTQLPKETQKNGDRQTNQKAQMSKQLIQSAITVTQSDTTTSTNSTEAEQLITI